jgi:prepilin-type N-terminal cleavage/methylation domain-containing protein
MTARPHNLQPRRSLATGHWQLATRPVRRGFTLTEVLIAMALVAVLIVGLGRIFQITSDTIKTGQAYQTALRKQKAVYSAISRDFLGYASDGNIGQSENGSGMLPISKQFAIVIGMNRVATFANRATASTNNDPVLSDAVVSDDQNARSESVRTTPSGKISVYQTGERNFRVDTIGFGASGEFARQTGTVRGGSSDYVSPMRSNEAFVWWGHGRVFNSIGDPNALVSYGSPGLRSTKQGNAFLANTNHRYAEEFQLARMALLMREPAFRAGIPVMYGDDGQPQSFVMRSWDQPTDGIQQGEVGAGGSAAANLNNSPLSAIAPVTLSTGSAALGRVDVVGASAAAMRERLIEVLKGQSAGKLAERREGWWYELFTSYTVAGATGPDAYRDCRPAVNPFPTRPLTTAGASQRAMLVGDACSQFIVEFAGDFYAQNPATGDVTATGPDGVMDFAIVNTKRVTRWYGLPRDADGDGRILRRLSGDLPLVFPRTVNGLVTTGPDVLPVRDFAPNADLADGRSHGQATANNSTSVGGTPRAYSFEKVVPPIPSDDDYSKNTTSRGLQDDGYGYVVAWGPEEFTAPSTLGGLATNDPTVHGGTVNGKAVAPVPQLIRIIVEMRDPAGALGSPVTQEYIFPVPQN